MNDTNLNDRQKKILNVLKEKSDISRVALANLFSPDAHISNFVIIHNMDEIILEPPNSRVSR